MVGVHLAQKNYIYIYIYIVGAPWALMLCLLLLYGSYALGHTVMICAKTVRGRAQKKVGHFPPTHSAQVSVKAALSRKLSVQH
jgi:hypothetical protein